MDTELEKLVLYGGHKSIKLVKITCKISLKNKGAVIQLFSVRFAFILDKLWGSGIEANQQTGLRKFTHPQL